MLKICTPCYGGMVTARYMQSMLQAHALLREAGVGVEVYTHSHESLITRARNTMASDFLRQEEFSHLLFIDADLGFPPEAPLRFYNSGREVVCGIYPVKHLSVGRLRGLDPGLTEETAVAASLDYAVKLKSGAVPDAEGFIEVDYGATGFMMIHRQALMRMAAAYPGLAYDYAYTNDESGDNFAFFETMIDPASREYLPEDYAFCRRHTDLGGVIHADIYSSFTHVGTFEYSGSFANFLAQLGRPGRETG